MEGERKEDNNLRNQLRRLISRMKLDGAASKNQQVLNEYIENIEKIGRDLKEIQSIREAIEKEKEYLGNHVAEMRKERKEKENITTQERNQIMGKANHLAHPSSSWHLRYFDEFIGQLDCSSHYLQLKVLNLTEPAKELTEVMAAFSAIRRHLILPNGPFDMKDEDTSVVMVGDGSTPRMASMFALRTKWTCFSVDPALSLHCKYEKSDQEQEHIEGGAVLNDDIDKMYNHPWKHVERLKVIPKKIHSIRLAQNRKKVIVIMMHCHVEFDEMLQCLPSSLDFLGILTCPCCEFIPRQSLFKGNAPQVQYNDDSMATQKNLINIWCFDNFQKSSFE